MNALVVADRASEWRRLKALVLDSVSSPITRRVYNLGLDEFIAWFTEEPRPAGCHQTRTICRNGDDGDGYAAQRRLHTHDLAGG